MGDVWPAAHPGQDGDYGAARLSPRTACEVRSYQCLTVTYTVGKFGLDDTGAIRIAYRFVHDGGPVQTADPTAPNYVSAVASNGVPLVLLVEPYAYRPWYNALRVTVAGGYLSVGDTITVTYGDRSQGSPGFLMQTLCEVAFQFKVSVDACATGQFYPLPDVLSFPVVAGPVASWKVVAPTLRALGETFSLGVKAVDAWGNPTAPICGPLTLAADGSVSGLPEQVVFPPGDRAVRVENLVADAPGIVRFTLRGEDQGVLAVSNPVTFAADMQPRSYWGDLHGQSGETVGVDPIENYLQFARDLAFLDVSGHQANDFQISNAFWDKINATTRRMNQDGTFIVFPGYEWSGNTPVGGDHNVFFRHENRQIRRSSHAMLADRDDIGTDATNLHALFDSLQNEDCVVYAHVGGRPADVGYAHDPKLRTAVELHSNWGSFEWILTDSLKLGHRVGVVCNSDGHKGRPGDGPPGATEFGAYGGLTCFFAPELTRDAIFEAMRRRHHYGTTGARIHLDVRGSFDRPAALFTRDPRHFDVEPQVAGSVMMGDIVRTDAPEITLAIRVSAASPIERIDILNGPDLIRAIRCYEPSQLGNRVRILWQGAEYRGRGRNTHWHGTITANGALITRMDAINHWNPERAISLERDAEIAFQAVTSGNFGGVDISFDGAPSLDIETNLVSGQIDLGRLGVEDHILDAGGLDRMIRVRRLPEVLSQCDLETSCTLPIPSGSDNAIWLRVATLDGHIAWSSPIYIER